MTVNSDRRVSFVLPGRGRSGGVRVTTDMANQLAKRGYETRILCRRTKPSLADRARALALGVVPAISGRHRDWLEQAAVPVQEFGDLSSVGFREDEVVIAVGTQTIRDVHDLSTPVNKLRYCHGLLRYRQAEMLHAWRLPMRTVTVASTLVPDLQALTGESFISVIPNGVDGSMYFDERRERDGIGTIFGRDHSKAPDTIFAVFSQLRQNLPEARQHLFGAHRRPAEVSRYEYVPFPSVEIARSLYNRSKIWLVLSRSEGFSQPILEAMACGCAVISTETDGARELVKDGENGLLIPIDDPCACVAAVKRLWHDNALRDRLIRGGVATAARFSWDEAAAKMDSYLRSLWLEKAALPSSLAGATVET